MKKIIVSCIMLTVQFCYATEAKSKKDTQNDFEKNQLSFALTNAMSQTFFDGPGHKPTTCPQYGSGLGYPYRVQYLPLYAFHLQMRYSIGISRTFGIESGLGYLFNMTMYDTYEGTSTNKNEHLLNEMGYITLPLYGKVNIAVGGSKLSFKFGPDFSLPVHSRSAYHYLATLPPGYQTEGVYKHRFTTNETGQYATMGLCAGIAYEKKIRSSATVSVGPVIDFLNLAQFHRHDIFNNNSGYHTIQYYIGLDVAINFGFHVITKSARF